MGCCSWVAARKKAVDEETSRQGNAKPGLWTGKTQAWPLWNERLIERNTTSSEDDDNEDAILKLLWSSVVLHTLSDEVK